jgi:sortase A
MSLRRRSLRVDRLLRGDVISVEMPYATVGYRVQGHRIVAPGDLSVLRRLSYDRLILSACHPLFSASRRIVVFAAVSTVRQSARILKVHLNAPDGYDARAQRN